MKTDKITQLAKEKTKLKEQQVLETIQEMMELGEKISFYSVYKKANVSKSFVYNHTQIREMIEKNRENSVKIHQKPETKETIIQAQKKKIQELEKQTKANQKDENWKEKYEKAQQEIKKLKEELETAYAKLY